MQQCGAISPLTEVMQHTCSYHCRAAQLQGSSWLLVVPAMLDTAAATVATASTTATTTNRKHRCVAAATTNFSTQRARRAKRDLCSAPRKKNPAPHRALLRRLRLLDRLQGSRAYVQLGTSMP